MGQKGGHYSAFNSALKSASFRAEDEEAKAKVKAARRLVNAAKRAAEARGESVEWKLKKNPKRPPTASAALSHLEGYVSTEEDEDLEENDNDDADGTQFDRAQHLSNQEANAMQLQMYAANVNMHKANAELETKEADSQKMSTDWISDIEI